eukprot:638160-Hanusia_phi.AAC.1
MIFTVAGPTPPPVPMSHSPYLFRRRLVLNKLLESCCQLSSVTARPAAARTPPSAGPGPGPAS